MTLITSRQNPRIKQLRALASRKQRQAQGSFVVEGIFHLGEAVESNAGIEFVLYAPELLISEFAYQLIARLELENVPVLTTTAEILTDLAGKEHPQGILAVVRRKRTPISHLTADNFSWGVAVEAPQDPGNLGTILRTLDAAGADGLIVIGNGTDITHPTAVRASMGSLFWKPVVYATHDEFRAWHNVHKFHLYGTSAKGSLDYRQTQYRRPGILLLGSEREGLSTALTELCEDVVRLPMSGRVTSLNLSVAAGILIYQMSAALEK